ncbi:MAG: AzlD domain-containing protein [Nocardioides sp.]
MWTAILLAALGCWLWKAGGMSVPSQVLDRPMVARAGDLIPIALLSALIAIQVFGSGPSLTVDARLVGLGYAVIALALRAPFLVVVFGAAAAAALARLTA